MLFRFSSLWAGLLYVYARVRLIQIVPHNFPDNCATTSIIIYLIPRQELDLALPRIDLQKPTNIPLGCPASRTGVNFPGGIVIEREPGHVHGQEWLGFFVFAQSST